MIRNNITKLTFKQKTNALIVLTAMFLSIIVIFVLNVPQELNAGTRRNLAMFMILFLLVFALYIYCVTLEKQLVADIKYIILISVIIVLSLQLNIFFSGDIVIYARPLLLPAMLITMLIGMQTGLFVNSLFMILLYFFDVYSGGFTYDNPAALYSLLCLFVSGTLSVTQTTANKRRFDTILTVFKIGISSMLCGMSLFVLFEGANEMVFFVALSSYISAYISLLIYLGILPVFEKAFNIVTAYRLNELTDHNRSLLKRLAKEAPGTFNHSLAVSNLAEACALAIGEDPQLARTAAYYHDIGKIRNPQYFKENQTGEDPHEVLTPELSASFIKKHTVDGYNICKHYRLPAEIANICLEHHGTTVIKYFYYQASKFTEDELSTKHFRYGGPKPSSKIAAIIMIADAAEAAIRTLTDRSKKIVEQHVKAIIDERMELEQFSDCDITMRDLYTIIDVIVQITASYYHERVEYPKFKLSKQKEETLTGTNQNEEKSSEADVENNLQ